MRNEFVEAKKLLITTRVSAELMLGMIWKALCGAAESENLESKVNALIDDTVDERVRNGQHTADNNSGRQKIVIPHQRDDSCKLIEHEISELNFFLGHSASNQITFHRTNLLMEAVSSATVALQSRRYDIAPLGMPQSVKEYVAARQVEMYGEKNLRHLPHVTLAKLMAMKMAASDRFLIELFGSVV